MAKATLDLIKIAIYLTILLLLALYNPVGAAPAARMYKTHISVGCAAGYVQGLYDGDYVTCVDPLTVNEYWTDQASGCETGFAIGLITQTRKQCVKVRVPAPTLEEDEEALLMDSTIDPTAPQPTTPIQTPAPQTPAQPALPTQ